MVKFRVHVTCEHVGCTASTEAVVPATFGKRCIKVKTDHLGHSLPEGWKLYQQVRYGRETYDCYDDDVVGPFCPDHATRPV